MRSCLLHCFVIYQRSQYTFQSDALTLSSDVNIHTVVQRHLPSVLWRCWLGGRKGTRPVKQEAQLSPRDRAMRRVNWNLANCHATVQKLLKLEIKLEAMRDRQCAVNHDAIESAPIVSSVINKPTTLSCVYHLSTDDLLWRNFLSPQCRNCSRDPDHAHLSLITRLRLHIADNRPVYEIWSL